MGWSHPLGSGAPTVTGRDMLLVSSAGFSVTSLTLSQEWRTSGVSKIEMSYVCGPGPAKGENRLPGKISCKQAFSL